MPTKNDTTTGQISRPKGRHRKTWEERVGEDGRYLRIINWKRDPK